MFAPIFVTVILSFNASMFGGFPMTGFSLHWYGKLLQNEAVLRAFKTSIWIALLTAVVCTVIGVMAAIALTRYEFRGKQWMNTLVILPALVPETILGVGLLLLMKWAHQPRSYLLLVLGHIMLALPFVVLVVQARLIGIKRVYEEAALSLGANRFNTFREVTLPLLMPAIVASRAARLHHLLRQHHREPVLAAARGRDHADADPGDAEDLHQPRDQCARNADDPHHRRPPLGRRPHCAHSIRQPTITDGIQQTREKQK